MNFFNAEIIMFSNMTYFVCSHLVLRHNRVDSIKKKKKFCFYMLFENTLAYNNTLGYSTYLYIHFRILNRRNHDWTKHIFFCRKYYYFQYWNGLIIFSFSIISFFLKWTLVLIFLPVPTSLQKIFISSLLTRQEIVFIKKFLLFWQNVFFRYFSNNIINIWNLF